jgi:hypothetical protein
LTKDEFESWWNQATRGMTREEKVEVIEEHGCRGWRRVLGVGRGRWGVSVWMEVYYRV